MLNKLTYVATKKQIRSYVTSNSDQKQILVCGATGNIGSRVVQGLVGKGFRIRAGLRDIAKKQLVDHPGVEVVEMNFRDPVSLSNAFKGVDRVFMVVPFAQDILGPSKSLLEAAKLAKAEFIVRISAIGVDESRDTSLGAQHAFADDLVKSPELPYVILRPNFFMENWLNHADTIKHQNMVITASGEGKATYIAADDIAHAAVTILADNDAHIKYQQGSTFTLTGSEAFSDRELAEKLSKLLGKPLHYVAQSAEERRQGLAKYGLPEWMIDDLIWLDVQKLSNKWASVDTSLKRLTGKDPILVDEWFKKNLSVFQ